MRDWLGSCFLNRAMAHRGEMIGCFVQAGPLANVNGVDSAALSVSAQVVGPETIGCQNGP
jgi:hypothetical protein